MFRLFSKVVEMYDMCLTYGKKIQSTEDLSKITKILDEETAKNANQVVEDVSGQDKEELDKYRKHRDRIFAKLFETSVKRRMIDYLSMLQLHVNVARIRSLPQQMLMTLATPYHLSIILKMLEILNPINQLDLLKILSGLHSNSLPRQLFDDAAKLQMAATEEPAHILIFTS